MLRPLRVSAVLTVIVGVIASVTHCSDPNRSECDPWSSRRQLEATVNVDRNRSQPAATTALNVWCPTGYQVATRPPVGVVCELIFSPFCGNFSIRAVGAIRTAGRLPNDATVATVDKPTRTVVVCRLFNESVPCRAGRRRPLLDDHLYLRDERSLLEWPKGVGTDRLRLVLTHNDSHGMVRCAAPAKPEPTGLHKNIKSTDIVNRTIRYAMPTTKFTSTTTMKSISQKKIGPTGSPTPTKKYLTTTIEPSVAPTLQKALEEEDEDQFLPVTCLPFRLPVEPCVQRSFTEDGRHVTLHVPTLDTTFEPAYFQWSEDGRTVNLCQPLASQYFECSSRVMLGSDQFQVMEHMAIHVDLDGGGTSRFRFGAYMMDPEGTSVLVCHGSGDELMVTSGGGRNLTGSYVGATASMVSAVFLTLAVAAHLVCPDASCRNARSTLLPLSASMLAMHVANVAHHFIRLSGGDSSPAVEDDNWRVPLAFATRYTFALATFFWLNVLAFDLWRVFAAGSLKPMNSDDTRWQHVVAKCLYAWGIPVLLCAIVLGVSWSPSAQRNLRLQLTVGRTTAWFQSDNDAYIFFYAPVIVILLENAVFFVLTVVSLRRAVGSSDARNRKRSRNLLNVFAKLFLVMGLGWLSEVLSMVLRHSTCASAWYAFDVFNLLQGVWLFLIYFGKRTALERIAKQCCHLGREDGGGTGRRTQTRDAMTITGANYT